MRQPVEPVIQEVLDLVCPHRSDFLHAITDFSTVGKKIFDGSPQSALMIWVDGIQGYLVSAAIKWFTLTLADERLLELPDVKDWLKDVEGRIYNVLGRSNFYAVMEEHLVDAGSAGTANLFIHEDLASRRLHFNVEHPRDVWLVNDLWGDVNEVHVLKRLTLHEAARQYGKHNLSRARQLMLAEQPYAEIEVLWVVAPNDAPLPGARDFRGKAFRSYHLEVGQDHLLRTGGYGTLPGAFMRTRPRSGSAYGISPAEMAKYEITRLYAMGKSLMHAGHLASRPFWQAPREMRGTLKLTPDAINWYDDPARRIMPGTTGSNYPIGSDREEQARETIKRWYSVDFFLAMQSQKGDRTAEEIRELQSERASLLGPQMERLSYDLDAVIGRVYDLMAQAGQLPDPPAALEEAGEEPVRIEYVGPLAMARKQNYALGPVRAALRDIGALAQIDLTVLDNYDWDVVSRYMSEQNGGLPSRAVRDKQAVAALRDGRAQAQQAARTAEMLQKGAETAAKFQGPVDASSPMAAAMANA